MAKTIKIGTIKASDLKVAIGHQDRTGHHVHKDKRTKRLRTRSKNRQWRKEAMS